MKVALRCQDGVSNCQRSRRRNSRLRPDTDKAHCLNDTAARVWKNCDGPQERQRNKRSTERRNQIPVFKDEVVWLALDQLEEIQAAGQSPDQAGLSCRHERVARQLLSSGSPQ